jgi:poly(3-hydroxyoctanoate) depolymerase
VEGLRLRVKMQGSGPPLLLVTGLGGNIEMWQPLVEKLTDFETIAFDAPGMGESEIPRWPVSIRGLARITAGLVHQLGYARVDVLGVSYGGAIAQELAYRHRDIVQRMVLAATSFGIGSLPGKLRALAMLSTPYRYYSRSHFKAVAPLLYGGRIARQPDLIDRDSYARLGHAPSWRGYAWQLAAIAGWSSLPYLRRIRVPVMVLTGDADPIIRVFNGRVLAALIPGAQLHVMRRSGHLFLIDEAAKSAELIRTFLTGGVTKH